MSVAHPNGELASGSILTGSCHLSITVKETSWLSSWQGRRDTYLCALFLLVKTVLSGGQGFKPGYSKVVLARRYVFNGKVYHKAAELVSVLKLTSHTEVMCPGHCDHCP